MGNKSDVLAKEAYARKLREEGYDNVEIVPRPSDIIAYKNGEKYYFEIKKTGKDDKYFGAATLTEWEQALKTPNNYKFVVAIENGNGFIFKEYSPDVFIKYSSIPPYKIYFNIDFSNEDKYRNKINEEDILKLVEFYNSNKK